MWTRFFDTVFIVAPTNNWKACPRFYFILFLLLRYVTDTTIRRNARATAVPPLKKKEELFRQAFRLFCMCGSNMSLNFQMEIRKIERGIAEIMPCTICTMVLALLIVWNHFAVTSIDA